MNISKRDWVKLSSFLDGELNQKEMEKIRHKIETDPAFQAALEELRLTRKILKQTPELQVPRDFTLSPSQVGLRTRRPVYKNYRLAAALMSFLLIGVLILDFGGLFISGGMAPAMAPVSEELLMEKAVGDSQLELNGDPELSTVDKEAEKEVEEEQAEFAAAPEEEPAEGIAEEEAVPGVEAEGQMLEEANTPEVRQYVEPKSTELTVEDQELDQETSDEIAEESLPPPTQTAVPSPYPTESSFDADQDQRWEPVPKKIPYLRILEIVLAVGVLGLSLIAVIFKRRDR